MTNSSVLNKFRLHFNPTKLVAESTLWTLDQKVKLNHRLQEVNTLLKTRGQLKITERTDLTKERDSIVYRLVHDDPGCIENDDFDDWLRAEGLYDSGYSDNENRTNNKNRLNRLFRENEELFVLNSRGHKGVCFVMDAFASVLYETTSFHDRNTETVKGRSERTSAELDYVKEAYDLDDVFVATLKIPLETTAYRQENEDADHQQIMKIIGRNQELIEAENQKLIDANEEDKAA